MFENKKYCNVKENVVRECKRFLIYQSKKIEQIRINLGTIGIQYNKIFDAILGLENKIHKILK